MNKLGTAMLGGLLMVGDGCGDGSDKVSHQTDGSNESSDLNCAVKMCSGENRLFTQQQCDVFRSALSLHGHVRFCLDDANGQLNLEDGTTIIMSTY